MLIARIEHQRHERRFAFGWAVSAAIFCDRLTSSASFQFDCQRLWLRMSKKYSFCSAEVRSILHPPCVPLSPPRLRVWDGGFRKVRKRHKMCSIGMESVPMCSTTRGCYRLLSSSQQTEPQRAGKGRLEGALLIAVSAALLCPFESMRTAHLMPETASRQNCGANRQRR